MKKFLLVLFAIVLSGHSCADIFSKEFMELKINDHLRSAEEEMSDAQKEISDGEISEGFEDLLESIGELKRIVNKDSAQWKELIDLENFINSKKNSMVSEAKTVFSDVESVVKRIIDELETRFTKMEN